MQKPVSLFTLAAALIVAGRAKNFPDGMGPADVFRERVLCCFINDPVGG